MAEAPTPGGLRQVAAWLAGEFDRAGLFQAAAYAALAADAARDAVPADEDLRTDVELDFCLDEHGRVWIILQGDCHIIGRRDAVCADEPVPRLGGARRG